MSPVLRLVARIAESELRRHSSRDSEEQDRDNRPDGDDDGGDGSNGLKWWGILLIVYITILSLVFLSSFVYYWKRENERKRDGRPFSVGTVAWKAFTAATGIRVWIWVFTKRGWCGPDRKKGGAIGAGPYEQIDARQARAAIGRSPLTPSSDGSYISRPNTPARYGTPVNHGIPYPSYGQSNGQSNGPSKSPGYRMANNNFLQQESIPMKTLSPSPSPSPSHAPPPPYMSHPPPAELPPAELPPAELPPAELHGDDIQPNYSGRMR
ncbi:hypothetical protein SAMD00023353_6700090 [Rosellinia necatrix]|uniref:Uncharacterized protein n=1 Tax=Rosellinia necatrix TaxID=77044 RepID=A0A1W2TTE3_ROSNE|nr:hypothetical protein SAMD00023353_6700090 [Rosellinia necatrix]